jgi:LPXTG-motif cell wall-anchored protein
MEGTSMSGRFGPVARSLVAVTLVAAATVAVGLRPSGVSAAPAAFTKIPTRLYMIPEEHSTVVPDVLAGIVLPIGSMTFADVPTGDIISGDSREIQISAEETVTCRHHGTDGTGATGDPSDDFDLSGCTAVQLDVGHGTLKFTPDPAEIDDPGFADPQFKMYRFASGALLRDADDPGDFEMPGLALIGTAAEINETLKTLVYTPTVDDPSTEEVDEDYYYDGSNPETLSVDLVPGDTTEGGTVTEPIDIRVLDYNNFPVVTVPDDEWSTDNTGTDLELFTPNANPSLEPDVPTLSVADEDNDEVIDDPQDGDDPDSDPGDGDDPDDGVGDQFLVIAWATCGQFSLWSDAGWGIVDDLEDVITYVYDNVKDPLAADPSYKDLFEEALRAALPDDVENFPFATSNPTSMHTVFAGVSNNIEELNYQLGRITFHPRDPVGNLPLSDMTCKVRTLITDIGNNGLPIQYLGDPPAGVEIPMFGVDFDTNYVPAVEEFTITIGSGGAVVPAITSVSNVTLAEGNAATTPFTFTLTLDAPAAGTESVDVSTSYTGGVELTNAADLAAITNQTVTFAAGATSATFIVPVNGDTDVEDDENFELNLSNPVGLTVGDPSGLGTVQNDDPAAGLQFTSFDDEVVIEGNPVGTTPVTFNIGLSAPAPAGGASVRVTTSHGTTDGTDLTPLLAQQVTFLAGQQTRTVTVNVDRDATVEPTETFTATLSSPVGASIAAAAQSATGTITNDDFRTVSIGDVSMLEGNAGTTAFTFTLTLNGPAVGGETVQVATGGGTATSVVDYMPLALVPVNFVPGATTADVTVNVNGDTDFEPDDTFFVTLVGPSNLVVGDGTGQGTILNDDPAPDVTDPTVTINQGAGQLDPTSVSPIAFDVVFSEPVTGFVTGDVTLGGTAGATMAVVTPINATTYTVAVSGMTQDGTVIASIAADVAVDAAANGNAPSTSNDNQVTYDFDEGDVTDPTVTINQGAGQSDPTSVSPIVFDVVFSEPVTGFIDTDVMLSGTAGATTVMVTPTTASTYTVAVSGMTQDGTVIATVPAGAAIDAAMNTSEASTSNDNTVTFDFDEGDVTGPTVTINQGAAQPDPTAVSPIIFDVVFSEPVTGFMTGDVTLGGTALPTTAMVTPITPTNYTVSVSGMSVQGTVTASIGMAVAIDAATNANAASTSADNTVTFLIDQTAPTVTINQGAAQVDPTAVSPIIFDVVFSEAVTGFVTGDVTLGGTAGATTAMVTPITAATYTVAVSGMSQDGTVIATIAAAVATDAGMNASSASTSTDNQVTFDFDEGDVTDPTVTINQGAAQPDPTDVSPIVFDVVFSEPVTGFADADVALSGTALPTTAAVNGSGTTYTVSVSGMTQDGTVIASILAGAAMDAANNPSVASTSIDNVVTFDFIEVQPPSPLTITVPADITVPNDPGQPGALVSYAAPTTNGGVAPITVMCSSPSGGFYPIGVTTVTCTATDSAQGQGQLALAVVTDSFTITVVDTTPPSSTTPPVTPPATPPTSGVTAPDVGQLPATGGDTNTPLVIAFGACLVGLVLLAVRRRTRPAG